MLDQAAFWLPRTDRLTAEGPAAPRGHGPGLRRPVRLVEISDDRLANVLGWLHERASELHFHAMVDAVLEALVGGADGELLAHEVGASLVDVDPAAWLEATVLVRAIRGELRQRQECDDPSR